VKQENGKAIPTELQLNTLMGGEKRDRNVINKKKRRFAGASSSCRQTVGKTFAKGENWLREPRVEFTALWEPAGAAFCTTKGRPKNTIGVQTGGKFSGDTEGRSISGSGTRSTCLFGKIGTGGSGQTRLPEGTGEKKPREKRSDTPSMERSVAARAD